MSTDPTQPIEPATHQLSEGLADAVEAAAPSVVTVYGRRRLPGTGVVWQVPATHCVVAHSVEAAHGTGV